MLVDEDREVNKGICEEKTVVFVVAFFCGLYSKCLSCLVSF